MLSRKQKVYLHKISRSAGGLLTIVNDILDITKIDAGEFTVEKIPFYLHEIISECRTSVVHSADKKGLNLIFQDETAHAKKIIGNPTKLRQTLLNLLSNAVKFTEKGSVTVPKNRKDNIIENILKIFDSAIVETFTVLLICFEFFFLSSHVWGALTKNVVENNHKLKNNVNLSIMIIDRVTKYTV